MSWMDSWSRPNKSSATPPPLYLTSDDVRYCVACGRHIGARRSHTQQHQQTEVKYCSDGCRRRKLGKVDRRIDEVILGLLEGREGSGIEGIDVGGRMRKGDRRRVIFCEEVEGVVFGRGVGGGEGNRDGKGGEDGEGGEDEAEGTDGEGDGNGDEGVEVDPASLQGRRPNPTGPGEANARQAGQKRADEREMVRRAARRAVVFGFPVEQAEGAATSSKNAKSGAEKEPSSPPRRKCEAVMSGHVVEPSFAKGNWAIRWRE